LKAVIIDYAYLGEKHLFNKEIDICSQYNIDLELENCSTVEEIVNATKDADLVLCCGNPPITENIIARVPKVKAFIRYGIGVDSVDMEAATRHNKQVYNMPGFCSEELAMHASALILNILRNIRFYDLSVRNGDWTKAKGPKPRRLSNMTLGLFGFGGSAKELARIFKDGFKSKVIAYDPYLDQETYDKYGVERVSMENLLKISDIVSIHAPLNNKTKHFFNSDIFSKMKEDSILINVARGQIVNQKDLVDALEKGVIGYAGLDVFEKEPIEDRDKLLELENVLLTPHSAFYGKESLLEQHETAAVLIESTLIKNKVVEKNLVNKDVLNNKL
jgi:D-3-phosphoglycerate dehydrogenase